MKIRRKKKMKNKRFSIIDIQPSIRFAADSCEGKDGEYRDVVVQVGSRLCIGLKSGTEISGKVDSILIDTNHDMFLFSMDTEKGYWTDINPEDVEHIWPDDSDNCADVPADSSHSASDGNPARRPKLSDETYAYLMKRLCKELRGVCGRNGLSIEANMDLIDTVCLTLDVIRYEDWSDSAATYPEEMYR